MLLYTQSVVELQHTVVLAIAESMVESADVVLEFSLESSPQQPAAPAETYSPVASPPLISQFAPHAKDPVIEHASQAVADESQSYQYPSVPSSWQ